MYMPECACVMHQCVCVQLVPLAKSLLIFSCLYISLAGARPQEYAGGYRRHRTLGGTAYLFIVRNYPLA